MKIVNPQNAVALYKVADLYENNELKLKASKLIWEEFPKVEEEFKDLSKKELQSIVSVKHLEYVSISC